MARAEGRSDPGGLAPSIDPVLAAPRKRSITIAGHSTSITLEDAFWNALKAVAAERSLSIAALVAAVDATRETAGLSAAIRVFLLRYYQTRLKPID
jgi:predicted DNA-binding ribbon-helix-helix protein